MRILFTGDWHIRGSNLHLARGVTEFIQELVDTTEGDLTFIHGGDLIDEITSETEYFTRKALTRIADETSRSYVLVGNHDWEERQNWPNALFDVDILDVVERPRIVELEDVTLAFLPSPNRAMFGATREGEGRKARDAALSRALEAALINLETQIGPEDLGRAILLFHATVAGSDTGTQIMPKGLTWEIPAERLSRWGLAIGSHIHHPQQLGDNIYYAGGIFSQTFGERAESYRLLQIDVKGEGEFEVESIELPRLLTRIELILDQEGLRTRQGKPRAVDMPLPAAINALLTECGVRPADPLELKIRAQLPQSELRALPDEDALASELIGHMQRLMITREPAGLHKVRLEGDTTQMDLSELFGEWLRVSEIEPDPEVLDKARACLASLEAGSWIGKGKFGYKPLSLKVRNFCQWEEAEIDYRDFAGAVAVTGPNKIGKTTLWVKGPTFALHKKTSNRQLHIDDELRNGADDGLVEHMFEAAGKTWLVRRALERGAGGVSCKTELFEVSGEQLTPVGQTANEIQVKIEELVGSYEFVLSTFLGTQDDINRLIQATPADWGRLFLEALGLSRFEAPRKVAADNAQRYKATAEGVRSKIEELEEQAKTAQEALTGWEVFTGGRPLLRSKIESNEESIGKTEAEKKDLEKQKFALEVELQGIREKLAEQESLQGQLGQAKRDLEDTTDVQDPGPRPVEPGQIDEGVIRVRIKELEGKKSVAEMERYRFTSGIAEISGSITSAELELKSVKNAAASHEKQISEMRAALEKLEDPPCVELLEEDPEAVHTYELCPAWKAWSKGDVLEELIERKKKFEPRIDELRDTIDKRRTEKEVLEKKRDDAEESIKQLNEKIDAARKQLDDHRAAATALERWELTRSKLEANIKHRQELKEKIGSLEEKLAAFGELREKKERLERRIFSIGEKAKVMNATIEEHRGTIRDLEKALQQQELLEKQVHELKARIQEKREEIHNDEIGLRAWSLLERSLHSSGIPYLLMERMVGAFELEANEILAPTGMSVRIETISATKKGEARDKITITFIDERGEHPLPKASGYQVAVLGMALRAAMAIVGSKFYGNAPEMYVQDEGWGAFHEENYDIARELIASIAQRFRLFPYITHIERLAATADIRVRISRNGSGAPVVKTGIEEAA